MPNLEQLLDIDDLIEQLKQEEIANGTYDEAVWIEAQEWAKKWITETLEEPYGK